MRGNSRSNILRAIQRLNKGAGEPKGAVERLFRLVETDLQHVNALILERMRSDVPLIPELAGHIISSGGKRLRPMLTLAAAQICGYQGLGHIRLATAVEFIHTATLLHDDVVDESDLRRGKAAAHVLWGNSPSVLVGDFLFSRSFQLMVETGSLRVLSILSNASAVIAEGEVMQLSAKGNIGTGEDTYLKIIAAKTAALFAAASEAGAVVAQADELREMALKSYGNNLGIAFQLVDDALDYSGREAMMGKAVGDDFREGKLTLPVILALAKANAEEAEFWRRTMVQNNQTDADLTHAIHLIEKHQALGDTIARARSFADQACAALTVFPDSPMRRALNELAEFCVSRAH
jgi:octaprenyl-diphosphate synthase